MHIQQVRLEADEDDMGDHDDLPICKNKMQLRRLHEQRQPLQQLDEEIEDIKRLMLGSVETTSKEKLGRKAVAAAKRWGKETLEDCLGSGRISTAEMGSS
jgi:hypothetical protein